MIHLGRSGSTGISDLLNAAEGLILLKEPLMMSGLFFPVLELPGTSAARAATKARALQLLSHLYLRGIAGTLGVRGGDTAAAPDEPSLLDGWSLGIKWSQSVSECAVCETACGLVVERASR